MKTKPCSFLSFLYVLCFFFSSGVFASATDSVGADSSQHGISVTSSLNDYVARVVAASDEALNIQADVKVSTSSRRIAEQRFELEWRPSSVASTGSDSDSASVGLEASRRTTWGPEVTVGASHSFVGDDVTSTYLELNLGLFRAWGQRYIRSPLTLAEISHNQTLLSAAKRRQSLIFSAISTYYQVHENALLLNQSKLALERALRNLEVAYSRQKLGLTDKVDVYRAELSELDSREALKRQKRQYSRAIRDYQDLLAIDGQFEQPDLARLPILKSFYPEGWRDRLLNLNLDWQIHLLEKHSNELNLYIAQRNTLPDLELFFNTDKQFYDDPGQSSDLDWSVGLRVSSNLGLVTEKNVLHQERIRYEQFLRKERQLKKDLYADAQDALDDYASQEERLSIVLQKLEQSKRSLELTSLRFERGVSSNLDQIEAQEALNQTEVSVVQQKIALSLQAARIALTMGVLSSDWLNQALVKKHITNVPQP